MEYWTSIIHRALPGTRNMEIDSELFENSTGNPPTLRFYDWEKPTISIGYAQNIDEIDSEKCEREGIDIVVRPTGGRAVLHWNEITYSVIIPSEHELARSSVLDCYCAISNALILGLRMVGIEAQLSPGEKGIGRNPSCFSSISKYEVIVNGKKLIGSAQRRKNGAVLQQGSIPLGPEFKRIGEYLRNKRDGLEWKSTCLSECADLIPEKREIIFALRKGFERKLEIIFNERDFEAKKP